MLVKEDFQGAKYFPEDTGENKVHGIENANNNSTSPDNTTSNYGWTLTRLTSGGYLGPKFAKYEVREGQPLVGSAKRVRSEVTMIKGSEDSRYMPEMWYSFALRFPSVGMEDDPESHENICQWWLDGGEDSCLKMRNGRLYFTLIKPGQATDSDLFDMFGAVNAPSVDSENDVETGFTHISLDKWVEFVFHFKHSTGTDGFVEIWRDGIKIQDLRNRRTMHVPDLPKWKVGLYKSDYTSHPGDSIRPIRILHLGFIKVGDKTENYETMKGNAQSAPPIPDDAPLAVSVGADQSIDAAETSVMASITGLKPGHEYYAKVTVSEVDGETVSDEMRIVTKAEEPIPPDPGPGGKITGFKLVDATKETEVATIVEGGVYGLDIYGPKLNVKADTTSDVTKVKFLLSGTMSKDYTDKGTPFALHGDDGHGNYYYGDWNPPRVGPYTLKAIAYDSTGAELETKTINFSFAAAGNGEPIPPDPQPQTGFYGFGSNTTGGAGGQEVTVRSASEFIDAVEDDSPRIINVQGAFKIDYCYVGSNKTIRGIRRQVSKLTGTLRVEASENVLIQDLDLTAPFIGEEPQDCIAIVKGAKRVVVDHCSIVDWTDGGCDITKQATGVTVCNTIFKQTKSYEHALAVLIGADPNDADEGFLDVTLYNNIFDVGITDRCPFGRKGRIHLVNNVYKAYASYMYNGKVSSYVTAAEKAQVFAENQVFINGEDPYIKKESGGKIKNVGDKFYPAVTKVVSWNDTVFAPPYSYDKRSAADAEAYVLANAGRFK